jgi:predicted permease
VATVRRLVRRLLASIRPGHGESELAREITAHLRLLEERFLAQGLSADEARSAARRAFGGVEQVKERQRDERAFRWLTGWPMDLKLGVRMLRKSPGLTVIAGVALAVAIGAGAAYLEFTRDLMFPTLPVADHERIVGVRIRDAERGTPLSRVLSDFAVWRDNARTIEQLGAYRRIEAQLMTGDGRTDRIRAVEISASAFQVFPTPPFLGRGLTPGDERPDATAVMVIGHDVWRARFNADPDVIGGTARLDRDVFTIVGVMPADFGFPSNQNVWVPLKVQVAGLQRGEGPAIGMFGRLKPGVSLDAARSELQGFLHAPATLRTEVQQYLDLLLQDDREGGEAILFRAANLIFVLLLGICGVNVATLVFARTATREAEITVRTALGASRPRVTAQLLAEALVLCGVGAVAGLAVAAFVGGWVTQVLVEAAGQPRPFWWDEGLRAETILYAAGLAALAALIIGIVPAVKATGAELQGRLREAGAGGSTMKFGRLWTGVIVAQVAVTVVFLATIVSLAWTAMRQNHGARVSYEREQLLAARLQRESGDGRRAGISAETLRAVVERVMQEPGVVAVSYATSIPGTTFEQLRLDVAGPAGVEGGGATSREGLWSQGARVGVDFFDTVGIPLVAGRLFTPGEVVGGRHVAVVDETFVRLNLGGRSPIGQMVRRAAADDDEAPGPWLEIIGVVKDAIDKTRKGRSDAVLYRTARPADSPLRLLVRTRPSDTLPVNRLRAVVLSLDPQLHLLDVMSTARLAEAEVLPTQILLRIFVVLAAVAMLLSTAGIYALISFTLARRTREIGIRVALGAGPRRIITSAFARAFLQVGLGVLAGALPATIIITSGDLTGMRLVSGAAAALVVGVFVIAVALLACAGPLRRALRVQPVDALRTGA